MISAIEVEPAPGLPGDWRDETDLPVNRSEVAYVELDGKLHLFGGGKSHHVYDPVTESWSSQGRLPFKVHHIQGVALGGKIYLLGGLTSWPTADVGNGLHLQPGRPTRSRRARRCRPAASGAPAASPCTTARSTTRAGCTTALP